MENKLICSVDSGKGFTKYAYANNEGDILRDSFISRYSEAQGEKPIIGSGSYHVEYQGESYVFGVQGEHDLRDRRTKKDKIHRLFTLTAITEMLKDNPQGAKVSLAVNMPAGNFGDKEGYDEFVEMYKGEGNIEIRVNDVDYSFEIVEVVVLPEAAGFLYLHSDLCSGNVVIVDIGHLNINLLSLKDTDIIKKVSLDEGGIELELDTIERFDRLYDNGIDRDTVMEALVSGHLKAFGEPIKDTDNVIKSVKKNYVDKLIKKAKDSGVDLSLADKIYFIGGTSKLLEPVIKEHELLSKTGEVQEGSQWVTVTGNLVFLEVIMNQGENNEEGN